MNNAILTIKVSKSLPIFFPKRLDIFTYNSWIKIPFITYLVIHVHIM